MTLDFSHIAWALFLPACFAMKLTPGPSNANAFFAGARYALASGVVSVLGRVQAYAVLFALVAIGLGAALAASADAFWWIRSLGALYLIYLGVSIWRAPPPEPTLDTEIGWARLERRDFAIAIFNPKALAIFTAFLPQFLEPSAPIAPQIFGLGAVYLALDVVAASLYVLAGRLAGDALRRTGGFQLLQKGVGGFLIASGALLAATNR